MLLWRAACLSALKASRWPKSEAGEIVLFPQNDNHTLASAPKIKPVNARQLMQPSLDGNVARICHGGSGPLTRIMCGFLANEESLQSADRGLAEALEDRCPPRCVAQVGGGHRPVRSQ